MDIKLMTMKTEYISLIDILGALVHDGMMCCKHSADQNGQNELTKLGLIF